MPPPLRELIAYLREFNELQLDVLSASCSDAAGSLPLLGELVARLVETEQRRRYRRAGAADLPDLHEHPADALADAAADAHRIAASILGSRRLTCAELLPVGVFLELLGARLAACAEAQPAVHA